MIERPTGKDIRSWRQRNGFMIKELSEWLLIHRRSVESWEADIYRVPAWVWELMVSYENRSQPAIGN